MVENKIIIPVLEINIVEHCNLTCVHCDHSSPLLPKKNIDPMELKKWLDVLSKNTKVIELRIVGGEPLLHPNICDVVKVIYNSKISESLLLVTNGTLLKQFPEDLFNFLDGMWISIYPKLEYKVDINDFMKRATDKNVYVYRKEVQEFDIGLVDNENHNYNLVKYIYQRCISHPPRFSYFTLRNGRFFRCERAAFMEARLKNKRLNCNFEKEDSVIIRDGNTFKQELTEYINRLEPLKSCKFCLGSLGKQVKHEFKMSKEESHDIYDLINEKLYLPKNLRDE